MFEEAIELSVEKVDNHILQLKENYEDNLESKEKQVERIVTYAKPLEEKTKLESTLAMNQKPQPKTDFAKKAVVQPMKSEKIKVLEQKTLER